MQIRHYSSPPKNLRKNLRVTTTSIPKSIKANGVILVPGNLNEVERLIAEENIYLTNETKSEVKRYHPYPLKK